MKNVLELQGSEDGNRIKQGDLSTMRYILKDANEDDLKLKDLDATIYLSTKQEKVIYKYKTYVNEINGQYYVDFRIENIIPSNTYVLEVLVDNRYIFPSDNSKEIIVTSSAIGRAIEELRVPNLLEDVINYAKENSLINFEDSISISKVNQDSQGNVNILFSDGTDVEIPSGKDGKSFSFEDLTEDDFKKIFDYGVENGYFKQDSTDTSNTVVSDTPPNDTNKLWINITGGK